MNRPIQISTLALTAALLAAGSPSASASTDIGPEAEALAALEATARIDAAPDVLSNRAEVVAIDGGYVSETENTTVTLPSAGDAPVLIEGTEDISVYLPAGGADAEQLGRDLVAYDGSDGSSTVPVPKDDGSVQFVSMIEGPASPTEYRYDFELPAGAYLDPVEDGGVAIKADDDSVLYAVLAPWAVDASGTAVPTEYQIDGTSIVQHVAHGESNAYPIVADPWLGGTWVSNWSWYTGITRIALYPTEFGQWACLGNVYCAGTWQSAVQAELAKAQLSTTNKNKILKSTTRNQIGCHLVVGKLKSPWNLETNVADRGLAGFIAAGCNP